jgi:hypothetical protein
MRSNSCNRFRADRISNPIEKPASSKRGGLDRALDQRLGASEFDSLPLGCGGIVTGFCDGAVLAPDVVGARVEPFMPPLDIWSFDMSLVIPALFPAAGPEVCASAAAGRAQIAIAAMAVMILRFIFERPLEG